ncbi:hypothetical protein WJN01_02905 [Flavobacteriaceae bacterium SZ-1-7]|uniref:hypothetical protein n=1 Tax=Tamlana sedimenti TaxID=3134126 RepID=UPI0031209532
MKNWANLIVFLLSTLMLYNSLKVSATYAYYSLDPVGFIEKLCENKDKPEMQCNGQCHLKKVAQSSNEKSSEPTKLINFDELLLFKHELFNYNLTPEFFTQTKRIISYLNLYSFSFKTFCFHPPQS